MKIVGRNLTWDREKSWKKSDKINKLSIISRNESIGVALIAVTTDHKVGQQE